jgi:hypothetical protein
MTPKEEPKQETLKEAKFVTVNIESATGENLGKVSYIPLPNVDYTPKQETLEEVAERIYPTTFVAIFTQRDKVDKNKERRKIWIEGAKWQQERMFELVEEYNQMLLEPNVHEDHKEKSFKDWFEQFKKK